MNCPHCKRKIPYAVDTREAGSKGRAVNSPAQQDASRNNGAAPVRPGKAPRGRTPVLTEDRAIAYVQKNALHLGGTKYGVRFPHPHALRLFLAEEPEELVKKIKAYAKTKEGEAAIKLHSFMAYL